MMSRTLKLINLLLVLRRPNLSTELSFSRVHDYLKMSLRKISGETTSRVIGTIERIDAIQNEIERIQEAYDAAERVHRARQVLALSHAQLAGCEYTGAQLTEDAIQSRVTRLRRDLDRANNERSQSEKRTQDLQTEQYQVSGQIKALEASEGLQVATQLTSARERRQETATQLHLQEQSLKSAQRVIDENAASLDRQRVRFEQIKTESVSQLRELQGIAGDEALWDVAALQLEEAQRQVGTITPDASVSPEMPGAVTMLMDVQADERMAWLRQLEELHQRRDKIDAQVQFARSQETTRFQELDEARRHFQSVHDRGYEAQQNLDRALEPFFAESENASRLSEELEPPSTILLVDKNLVPVFCISIIPRIASGKRPLPKFSPCLEAIPVRMGIACRMMAPGRMVYLGVVLAQAWRVASVKQLVCVSGNVSSPN